MAKKVLLALFINKSTVLTALSRALTYLGYSYKVFDYRALTYPEKIIRIAWSESKAYELANKRLIEAVKDYRPDIFFTVKGERIFPESIAQIKKFGAITINWFYDDIQAFDMAKRLMPGYDLFCHFDPYVLGLLKKEKLNKSLYHFSFAADILPTDGLPDFKRARKYDVSFVGNYYPVREKYLPAVKDLGLKIWGNRRWAESSLKQNYQGWLPFKDLFSVLRQSKIGLNIQYPSPSWSLVNRAYDVISCGAMLLTEDKKEALDKFSPGTHLVVYRTARDLHETALALLKDSSQRRTIAQNGYRLVRNKYTYVQELKSLFKFLGI